ncbi:hypothetical protein AOL_s00215g482 [Orbilia oligospora ATCC 24927]|uniref:Uncharacterized protein n=1 Tax=Arthrobotrys oligospora (strain ATCC 24927 / CBS 115.81 / DSM 1491) TaxID=756982 RepID=G1XSY4_ARTOA|nr:hypothetical protein AOL_s00215g482 [Orbilia oligospora ATCC 24927]EGX43746.1 hypothetical protein AOL_s00215g482 [Orbilia oligospora ATCC 24927]
MPKIVSKLAREIAYYEQRRNSQDKTVNPVAFRPQNVLPGVHAIRASYQRTHVNPAPKLQAISHNLITTYPPPPVVHLYP